MAPDHLQAEVAEGIKAKTQYLNQLNENKKMKKLLMQQDKTLAQLTKDLEEARMKGGGDSREMERLWREEKERRRTAEAEHKRLLEFGGDDAWREKAEALEEEVEMLRGSLDDHVEEMRRLQDIADRAQDELDAKAGQLTETAGTRERREGKYKQKITDLEQVSRKFECVLPADRQDHASLAAEIEALHSGGRGEDTAVLEAVRSP